MIEMTQPVGRVRRLRDVLFAAILTLLAAALMSQAYAQDYKIGDIKIESPWSRVTPSGAKVAGGFMKITNTGKQSDRLIGGSLIAADKFEVHETRLENNVMRMRMLEKGLEIRPGQTVELKPGSYHVMFMEMRMAFKQGERVKGTLVFEKAGTVEVEYKIEAMGSRGGNHH